MKVLEIITEGDFGADSGLKYVWDKAKHRIPAIGAGAATVENVAYINAKNLAADALAKKASSEALRTGKGGGLVSGEVKVTKVLSKQEIDDIIRQSLNGLDEIRKADGTTQLVKLGSPEHTVVVKIPVTDVAKPTGPKPPRKLGRRPEPEEELPTKWQEVDLPWNDPQVPSAAKQEIRDKMNNRNYVLDDDKLFTKLKADAIDQAEGKARADHTAIRDKETERLIAGKAKVGEFIANIAKLGQFLAQCGLAGATGMFILEPFFTYRDNMKAIDGWLEKKAVPKDDQWKGYTGSEKDVYSWYLEQDRKEKAALITRLAANIATAWATNKAVGGLGKMFGRMAGKPFAIGDIDSLIRLGLMAPATAVVTASSQDIAADFVEFTLLGFKPIESIGGWFSVLNSKVTEINKKMPKAKTTPNWNGQTGTEPPVENPPTPVVNNNPTPAVNNNPTPVETPTKSIWDRYPKPN
jgi:hypothetical protein